MRGRRTALVLGILTVVAWKGGFAGSFQTAQSETTGVQGMSQAAAQFLSDLRAEAQLGENSTFSEGETVGIGLYSCSRFHQLLDGQKILGAQAVICFSPIGETLEKAARLCDGDCLKAQETSTFTDLEVGGHAVEAMQRALESDLPKQKGWTDAETGLKNPFQGTVPAAAEAAWIQSEDLASVHGAYVVRFQGAARPYIAYVDGRTGELVMYEDRIWFASARGQVYPRDPVTTPDLKKVRLEDLLSVDHLASPYWSIQNEDASPASSTEGDYLYGLESTHFDEVQLYYGLQMAVSWLIGYGYRPFRSIPAVVHYGHNYANAYYDGDGYFFGDGDGKSLKDLARDNSVVAHENGHRVFDETAHILMSGEGPAIHEGMADFIACATYNNPAVGTGVMMDEKPMRRCDTDILLTNSSRKGEAHDAGQIWSGALWEVHQSPDVGADAADKMAIDAMIRLKPTGSLGTTKMEDMYQAVMASDKALFEGGHQNAIKTIFARRGFVKKTGIQTPTNWLWPKAPRLIAFNSR